MDGQLVLSEVLLYAVLTCAAYLAIGLIACLTREIGGVSWAHIMFYVLNDAIALIFTCYVGMFLLENVGPAAVTFTRPQTQHFLPTPLTDRQGHTLQHHLQAQYLCLLSPPNQRQ